MRPRLLAFLLIASTTLAFLPNPTNAITFSSGQVTSTTTTGGLDVESATLGTLVVVAHRISNTGAIVVDVSTNSGSTWATKATGLVINNPHPIIVDSSNILIIGSVGTLDARNPVLMAKSTDTGQTWTTSTLVAAPGTTAAHAQAESVAAVALGGRVWFAYNYDAFVTTNTLDLGAGPCAIKLQYSDDAGGSWTSQTPVSLTCRTDQTTCGSPQTASTPGKFGINIYATSSSEWNILYSQNTETASYGGGTSGTCSTLTANPTDILKEIKTTNTGGSYTDTGTVNDVFTPLSAPFGGHAVYAKGSRDLIAFTDRVTAGKFWSAERQSDGWHVNQFTGTANLGTYVSALKCQSFQIVAFTAATATDEITAYIGSGSTWNPFSVTGTANAGNAFRVSLLAIGANLNAFIGPSTGSGVITDYMSAATCTTAAAAGIIGTTTVNGLIGFDVDPFNQVVVSRTTEGSTTSQKINTYDSSSNSLAPRQVSPLANSCATNPTPQFDGVMAYSTSANGNQYAGFVDCDGSNIVNDFSIRNGALGVVTTPPTFCGTDFVLPNCDFDVHGESNSDCPDYHLPDGSLQIGNIAAIPIDGSNGGGGNTPHVQFGFAYSNTANGNIGTWAYREQNLAGTGTTTYTCQQEVNFSTPGNTYQICSWRNTVDNQDYIAAVGPNNPTKAWRFDIDPFVLTSNLHTTLTPIAAGLSAPYDHLRSIACVDNDAIVVQNGGDLVSRIHVVGGGIGGVVWGPISTGSVVQRGAAVSRDGRWGAIIGGTDTIVLNATSGAVLGHITTPSGTFKEIRMSSAGQVLWIATSTRITEYDVHSLTTIISVAEGTTGGAGNGGGAQVCRDGSNNVIPCSGGTTTTGTSGPIGSFFGVDPARLDPSGGGDSTKGGFFLSLMIILGFASVGAGILPGKSPATLIWGAGLGALIGFGWTVFLGTMPAIITFILIVIGFAIVGFKLKAAQGEAA